MIPPRIKKVEALDNFLLKLTYVSGEIKIYDAKKIMKHDFYRNLNNVGYFKTVKNVQTTIEWPNGEDIDPNELYENSVSDNV